MAKALWLKSVCLPRVLAGVRLTTLTDARHVWRPASCCAPTDVYFVLCILCNHYLQSESPSLSDQNHPRPIPVPPPLLRLFAFSFPDAFFFAVRVVATALFLGARAHAVTGTRVPLILTLTLTPTLSCYDGCSVVSKPPGMHCHRPEFGSRDPDFVMQKGASSMCTLHYSTQITCMNKKNHPTARS